MLEKKYKFVPEFFPGTNSYTIHRDCFVYDTDVIENGGLIATGRNSMAFTCDMLDQMKAYIGDENHDAVKAASVMWTPEIIADFKARQAEQEAAMLAQE